MDVGYIRCLGAEKTKDIKGNQRDFPGWSLMIQWLRLCPPNAGGPGSILGQRIRSHMSQLRPSTAKGINIKKKKAAEIMVEKEKETFLGKRSDCVGPGESKEPDPAARPLNSPPQLPPLRE